MRARGQARVQRRKKGAPISGQAKGGGQSKEEGARPSLPSCGTEIINRMCAHICSTGETIGSNLSWWAGSQCVLMLISCHGARGSSAHQLTRLPIWSWMGARVGKLETTATLLTVICDYASMEADEAMVNRQLVCPYIW